MADRLKKFVDIEVNGDEAASQLGKVSQGISKVDQATKNLNSSVSQIGRELPNFGQSFEIGVRSVTNNIGALIDGISQVRASNAALVAEGLPVKSLFSSIAGAILNWQTLLFVGIAVISSYSKEIKEFVSQLFKANEAVDGAVESQKALTAATTEGTKKAVEEQIKVSILLETAKDLNLSYKERKIAVDEIQKQYPFYFGNLTKEQILAGDTAKAERELAAAILSRALAQAAISKITENQGKIIDNALELEKAEKEVTKATREQEEAFKTLVARRNSTSDVPIFAAQAATKDLNNAKEKVVELKNQQKVLEQINQDLLKFATENQKGAIGLEFTPEPVKKPKTGKTDEQKEKERLAKEELLRIRALGEEAQKLESESFKNREKARKDNELAGLTEQDAALKKVTDFYDAQILLAEKFNQDITELQTAKWNAINDVNLKYQAITNEQFNKAKDDEIAATEAVAAAKKNALDTGLNILSEFAGKNKAIALAILAVQKGLAIAEIVTNAVKGIAVSQANLSAVPVIIPGTFLPNPAFPVALAAHLKNVLATKISAATGIATILAQTITSASSTLKGGDTGGASGGGSGAGAGQAAQFNIVGASQTNQLASELGKSGVIKAQVVSTEMTSQQAIDRNRIEQSVWL